MTKSQYEEDLAAASAWVGTLNTADTVYRTPKGLPWRVSLRQRGDGRGFDTFLGVVRHGSQRRQYKSLRFEDLIAAHKATIERKAQA